MFVFLTISRKLAIITINCLQQILISNSLCYQAGFLILMADKNQG